ncbi:CPBP family intramembrane glutamic endopeptidase [Agromyces bracchium]|uniref:CPBP family intramembrane metalloprotease n=1 Tax=Agromyces bracchium TaxID=88376 RepID=A0A6I3M8D3_9MICO|nr:CPBP family intramembrane glutamic endopeptidase [Agromyces bracchium]MTH69485.1 CPBP family intramembrane metalloprotease [Agromyces bracchium]
MRVQPKPWIGLSIAIGYLLIILVTTLLILDDPGRFPSVRWALLHQVLPVGIGIVFLVIATSWLGWWRPALFERERKRLPWWLWILPLFFAGGAIFNFVNADRSAIPIEAMLAIAAGTVCIAFAEELAFRGGLLVGLRARFNEWIVWLVSSLVFASAHLLNVAFGDSLPQVLGQVAFAFGMGSVFYVTRRLTGTLFGAMLLHFLWDYAGFFQPSS